VHAFQEMCATVLWNEHSRDTFRVVTAVT